LFALFVIATLPRRAHHANCALREKVAAQLAIWGVGTGDLAICGGACGSDILFAEECQRLGAPVRLLLALPRSQFVAQSVAFAGYDWVRRFDRLTETCEVAEQPAVSVTRPQASTFSVAAIFGS
jgi:hypothetical protein